MCSSHLYSKFVYKSGAYHSIICHFRFSAGGTYTRGNSKDLSDCKVLKQCKLKFAPDWLNLTNRVLCANNPRGFTQFKGIIQSAQGH